MKIIADENIPLVQEFFGHLGEVALLPGRQIQPHDVQEADILLVRSVTAVNQALLKHSRVKFVGSATTGADHVDNHWLTQNGIAYATAQGCNATAVAEYVVACIAALQEQGLLRQQGLTAGVIGVGHVGRQVAAKLALLGFTLKLNDPPRAEQEPDFNSVSLEEVADCDLICVHPPLTKSGNHPTFHLLDKAFLRQLKPGTVLINASRGAVINSVGLLNINSHLTWCLDVWENEPTINLEMLKNATIATPHIAGYTYEARLRGTEMIYESAQQALQLPITRTVNSLLPTITHQLTSATATWRNVVLETYHPLIDTRHMRDILLNSSQVAHNFDLLRKHHNKRHEFNVYLMSQGDRIFNNNDKDIVEKLGFRLV